MQENSINHKKAELDEMSRLYYQLHENFYRKQDEMANKLSFYEH